jgi:myo-inositol-1(or 4)-monophosphatase
MHLSANDLFLLTQCAISAAYQAGQLIAEKAQQPVTVNTKNGGVSRAAQVVTEVDHLSQDIILNVLQPTCARFDLALLTEESPDDRERLKKDYFWSVDPLDGTLPFIESIPGYAVSIALVSRQGEPFIGVVYDPLRKNLFYAIKGGGVFGNSQPISLPETAESQGQALTFITDRSFAQEPHYQATLLEIQRIAAGLGYAHATLILQGGAAMNACQVLTNPATCYFKFPKQQQGGGSLWDYAATACLFNEIGAVVSDMMGSPLQLNRAESTFMNHCGVLYCTDLRLAIRLQDFYQKLL